jgi:DNA-binding MarR family transcriptional regulator
MEFQLAPIQIKRLSQERILDSIRKIVRALRLSSRSVEKHFGLSGAQLFVLQKLKETSTLTINELAERTLTHQSSVSVVVSRLVEKDLVKRSLSKKDARKIEVTLTSSGKKLLKSPHQTAQERLVGAVEKFSPQEQEYLATLLEKMLAIAELDEVPATLFFEEDSLETLKKENKHYE